MALSEEECSTAKSRSSSSSALSSSNAGAGGSGNHYLAKCVVRGSVVLHVVYGRIRSPNSFDMVFGKETSLELVVIGEDGILQSVSDQPVFGTIKDLAILPWKDDFFQSSPEMVGRDFILVLSDSGKLSVLSFCNEMHRFFPVTQVQLSSPGNSRDQLGRLLTVDSSGSFIAMGAYENQLAMLSVSAAGGNDIIDKKLVYPPESEEDTIRPRSTQENSINGTIWSMSFVTRDISQPSNEHNPVLAVILNRKKALHNELLILEWNFRDHAVSVISQYVEPGALACDIVEVPHSCGFAIIFRVGDALVMDLRDPHKPCCVYRTNLNFLAHAVEEPNSVEEPCKAQQDVDDDGLFNVAACALLELREYDPMCIDSDSGITSISHKHACSWSWQPGSVKDPRLIFCLDTGEFFLLEFCFDSGSIKVSQSDCLYKGLPCKSLLWVKDGFLACLVEMGDGMVLKLEGERITYSSPIQNIAPILDMSIVDYYDEKRDQIFSCCGVVPEGSLRVIQSGIIVDRLFKTEPTYQGITGTWTVRMVTSENYHSFLVLSFVEETRVLSVGLRFSDVTESVGFQSDVSTLACGLLNDGVLVQIHQRAVRLCLPTEAAHSNGVPLPSPVCTSWWPDNMTINLGAVSRDMIIVSTSNPSIIFILGARLCSPYKYEIFEMQQVRLQYELSCISIPQKCLERKLRNQSKDAAGDECLNSLLSSIDTGKSIIVGTHKPSVEILIFDQDGGLKVLANGTITVTNIMGTAISGCVPQDVRLVYVDRLYVLSGLRNGMLLRFEWPYATTASSSVCPHQSALSSLLGAAGPVLTSISALNTFGSSTDGTILSEKTWSRFPINLQLIAMRRIGITPVFLVPLSDSLDADIIALSDRPWLLHTDRHSLSYTSISYPSSTHATSVSCIECPNGILFVSENCLHLVEMVNSKRLNVQKFNIGGTPRKVVYHSDSRLLLMMRTELTYESCSSDICCVDPLSGIVLTSFKLERGEIGKSMDLVRVGNEQVLVVGTSLASRPAIMPSGEAESGKGRLIILSLQHVQNSDSGSMTICSKGGLSSQQALAVPEIGHNAEHLFSSSMCSSPDDNTSCDGIKIDETEAWELRVAYSAVWPGIVLAICPYLERYFLASASSGFYVCGFPNDTSQRVRKYSLARTRFMVTSLTAHFTRIAVGDCRDGVLFFSYDEDSRKLDPLYCDPSQRLVGDCILMDMDTAVVSDRKGSIAVLSSADHSEDNASPECNLAVSCAYYMGEISMSIKKGSFSYRLPVDSVLKGSNTKLEYVNNTIIASTLLGSVINFVPLSRREYELLEAVQARLVIHPLTAPILGNDHNEFRGRENPNGVPKILDGDMLTQFLELTSMQQEAILTLPLSTIDPVSLGTNFFPPPIPINQVVLLLERLHYALN